MFVPNPLYPSIVSYRATRPPAKIEWTPNEKLAAAALFLFSPVVVTFLCTIVLVVLPLASFKRWLTGPDKHPDHSWIAPTVKKSASSIEKTSDKRSARRNMVKNLNTLGFTRVDVYLRFTNAHAQIINRKNKPNSKFTDVIAFLCDEIFEELKSA